MPTWSVGRLCPHFPPRPQAGLGRGRARAPAQALCPSPAGSSLSSESSPVSSPATNHSSPASTPKRVPMGPIIVPPGGHSVPSTPPVVTIAPTKTVNGVWRSESRQVSGELTGSFRVEIRFPLRELGDSSCPEGLCVSRALPGLVVWGCPGEPLRVGSGRVSYRAGGPCSGCGQGQALLRPHALACERPSCPCIFMGSSVRACALVSSSSKDTRARPSDRTPPRSPLHTPPVSRTWSLCEVLGVGTPTEESGETEWCLHIMRASCKRELLLFLSVVPTFSQVAFTDTCLNCQGLPAPGGLSHTWRGSLGVRPGGVAPRGTRPHTPSLEGPPN